MKFNLYFFILLLSIGLVSAISINHVSITPEVTYKNDTLQGWCNASSSNNITQFNYSWYKNGVMNITGNLSGSFTNNISYNIANLSNSFVKNDNIIFSCNAYDGVDYSGWSNVSVIIQNSPPVMVSSRFSPNESVFKNTTIGGYCNASDVDGDYITYGYNLYLNTILNLSNSTTFMKVWIYNSSLVVGLGDIGTDSTPSIVYNFSGNNKFNLISGVAGGGFSGFEWNGTSWISNSSLVTGLGDIGVESAPTIIRNISGNNRYNLISGHNGGSFLGFEWNGTSWISNSSLVTGLGDIGSYSKPFLIYNFSGNNKFNLISGASAGGFSGFEWNGTSWISNSSLVTGLFGSNSYSYLSIIYDFSGNNKFTLIGGYSDGSFNGFEWNGTSWISNSSLVTGLGNAGSLVSPIIFYNFLGNNKYTIISGNDGGTFSGFEWNSNLIYEPSIEQNFYNFTNISKNNNLTFQCQAYDGMNYSSKLNSSILTILNSLPITSTPTLNNTSPYTNDSIKCSNASTSDVDGDIISYYYKWYDTNVLISGQSTNILSLMLSGLDKNDNISCEVIPYDQEQNGSSVNSSVSTIKNSAPIISLVSINNTSPFTNEDLNCTITASDLDGDSLSYYYSWYDTNVVISGQVVNTLSLLLSGLDKNDQIKCQGIAYDGTINSTAVNSSVSIIQNSAPTFNQSNFNFVINHNQNISLLINVSDIDSDTLTFSINDSRFTINSTSGLINKTNSIITTGVYNTTINVTDGINKSIMWVFFNITNTQPSTPTPYLSVSVAYKNTSISCIGNGTDADGDNLTYFFKWFVNNTLNATTQNITNISKNDIIKCEVISFDGLMNSTTAVNSSQLTIQNSPPYLTSVSINNTSPKTNDMEKCTATGVADIDGDTITTSYGWLLNSVLTPSIYTNDSNFSLSYSGYNKGVSVACRVNLSDGENVTYWNSSSATILNTLPNAPNITTILSNNTLQHNPLISFTTSDDDGDSLTTYLYINGSEEVFTTGLSAIIGVVYPLEDGNSYLLNARSYDGSGYSGFSNNVMFKMGNESADLTNHSLYRFGENLSIVWNITLGESQPTNLTFTIVRPNGSLVLNNSQGFNNSDSTVWNSSYFVIDTNGTWYFNVSYFNTTESHDFVITDVYSVSPSIDSASFGVGILHSFDVNISHDGSPSLSFFYVPVIQNQSNWSIGYVNESFSSFNFTIDSSMGVGVYSGYIEVYRVLDNLLLKNISLLYSISLLSGQASISKNNSATTFGKYSDESFGYSHNLTNVGDYVLSNCSARFDDSNFQYLQLSNYDFYVFNFSNTSIGVGESVNLSVLFSNVPGSGSGLTYVGLLQVRCIADINGAFVDQISTADKPSYLVVSSTRPVVQAPSGGGGGAPPQIIVQAGNMSLFSVETSEGSVSMSRIMFPGESKSFSLIVKNLANTDLNLNVKCEGLLCNYVKINPDEFIITSNGVDEFVVLNVSLPSNIPLNSMFDGVFTISDGSGHSGSVSASVTVSGLAKFLSKFSLTASEGDPAFAFRVGDLVVVKLVVYVVLSFLAFIISLILVFVYGVKDLNKRIVFYVIPALGVFLLCAIFI